MTNAKSWPPALCLVPQAGDPPETNRAAGHRDAILSEDDAWLSCAIGRPAEGPIGHHTPQCEARTLWHHIPLLLWHIQALPQLHTRALHAHHVQTTAAGVVGDHVGDHQTTALLLLQWQR